MIHQYFLAEEITRPVNSKVKIKWTNTYYIWIEEYWFHLSSKYSIKNLNLIQRKKYLLDY